MTGALRYILEESESEVEEVVMKCFVEKIEEKDQKPFIALVDQILELKKEGKEDEAKDLETEIDLLVYQLYDLKPDEIEIVKGNKV